MTWFASSDPRTTRHARRTSSPVKFRWETCGKNRRVLIGLPKSGVISGLAVELHGSGQDSQRQYAMSRLADELALYDIASLIPQAAYPFQLDDEIRAGFAWNIPNTPLPGDMTAVSSEIDDISWLCELISTYVVKLSLGAGPKFICGYSGGARLAAYLLDRGLDWNAAAFVSGMRLPSSADAILPPTISFHGLEDRINPFAGGSGTRWDLGVRETAEQFAGFRTRKFNVVQNQIPGGQLFSYNNLNGEPQLLSYEVAGANHAWPGTRDPEHLKDFGPSSSHIDASRLIAEFFTRYR